MHAFIGDMVTIAAAIPFKYVNSSSRLLSGGLVEGGGNENTFYCKVHSATALTSSITAKSGVTNGGLSPISVHQLHKRSLFESGEQQQRISRFKHLSGHLSLSSPSTPSSSRRPADRGGQPTDYSGLNGGSGGLGGRRCVPASPKRQLSTTIQATTLPSTPRLCRKVVVAQGTTAGGLMARPPSPTTPIANRKLGHVPMSSNLGNGSPKSHSNEQQKHQQTADTATKCRMSCRLPVTVTASRLATAPNTGNGNGSGCSGDKDETGNSSLNSHTISSYNKMKTSISSSNTSRDTSIESIIPKYKAHMLKGAMVPPPSLGATAASGPQKRSYNPQLSIKTNKFILNDGGLKKTSNGGSVLIPRIRANGTSTYRSFNERTTTATATTNMTRLRPETSSFKVLKQQQQEQHGNERKVPDMSTIPLDDADDFFHRDPSNESLYIDFSKKVSPPRNTSPVSRYKANGGPPSTKSFTGQRYTNKENYEHFDNFVYKLEVSNNKNNNGCVGEGRPPHQREVAESKSSQASAARSRPVMYVTCASWIPKCNNKYSLRERRLLEESKTISRKR